MVLRLAPVWVVLALLVLLVPAPATVEAHANYAESEPAANSVVDEPPKRVTIRFTEPLEPALSEVQVFDSLGGRVDRGDSLVDASDPLVMSVSVGDLVDGTYTVAWKNVSTVDGHRVRGAFVFSVGEPISGTVAEVEIDESLFQSPAEPVIQWLVLLGALSLVGAVTFHLLVWRPALGGLDDTAALIPSLTRLVVVAAGVLLAASVAQLIVQASVVFESSLVGAFGGPVWELLIDTEWGRWWLWRVALGAASAVAVIVAWRRGDSLALAILGAVLGAASLLTISLTSHAAATVNVRIEAIINDFMHLVAVAVWVGGLMALVLAVRVVFKARAVREPPLHVDDGSGRRESHLHGGDGPGRRESPPQVDGGLGRREVLSALVRRFSLVAGLSVAVIILTGLYSAWAQVTVLPALDVPYGSALRAKVAVVVALLLVAAANLVWVRPRLRAGDAASVWLRRLVGAEIVLAVIVLLVVGFLTSLEPARQVASREGIGVESGLTFEEMSEGASMGLEIDPGQVGPNTINISLTDMSGRPITNATDVRVRLSYLDADFGETPYSATEVGPGEFVLDDQLISIAGAWQVELIVQRSDAFDARAAFRFEVTGGSGNSLAIAPEADTGRALLGIEFVVLGFLFMGVSIPIGGFYSRGGAAMMAVGAVVVIAGGALLFATLGAGDGLPERNPIAPTQESVALGMGLYEQHCQLCHGVGGLGDGPGGVGLQPPPADLVVHVPLHPDRALFEFIRDGVPNTAMAPLGDKLSEDEIWHVINYIQTLE